MSIELKRPRTNLFMLTSIDGKISTGAGNDFDVEVDIPRMPDLAEGFEQYYSLLQETDLWCLNSGFTMAKCGANTAKFCKYHTQVKYVMIDNTHLSVHGVEYIASHADQLVVITSNSNHPAIGIARQNKRVSVINVKRGATMEHILEELYKLGCKAITIQTGGTLNKEFFNEDLIDMITMVVAPIVVGGANTPSMVDGKDHDDLQNLQSFKLWSAMRLKNDYLGLLYYKTGRANDIVEMAGNISKLANPVTDA